MAIPHFKENGKYRMYEAGLYLPLNFSSSVASARKSVQSANKRPRIEADPTYYLNSLIPSRKNSNPRARNYILETSSASHIQELKASFKRTPIQKPGASKTSKPKNSPKLNCALNAELTKSKAPYSTKQQDRPRAQRLFVFPQLLPCAEHEQRANNYKRLVKLLEGIKKKSRCATPCGQSAKGAYRRSNGLEGAGRGKYREGDYETFEGKASLAKSNCNTHANDDPYRVDIKPTAARNSASKTAKSMASHLLKSEDTKRWRKHLDDNGESCSTADKLSLHIDKAVHDDSSSDKLTVIENDCENNYDLIYKCLRERKI
eukprot:TRINITY_DN7064_c0_g3_i2.p1 TRINITY_DN7064_c0_g3~~TRINITY_DN7064_c0_g3_i2.p1  ORF type:complete len:317 (+),score=73.04 TRINITY_DN7064_c0_g3_i2:79-1029(+)